jgi:hypothetical protein
MAVRLRPAGARNASRCGDLAHPVGEDVGMTDEAEVEALVALLRARYGARLTGEQLAELRDQVTSQVARARALRAVRLANSDEPAQSFTPYRLDA